MSDKSSIEWTDATWNPIRGCSRVSEGCRNCYAERVAARFSGSGQPYDGLANMTPSGPRWTGRVQTVEKHMLDPVRWKRPRRIFVNSMSDLFHEKLDPSVICRVFGIMAAAPQHTFQVLTKRPERMRELVSDGIFANDAACFRHEILPLEEPAMRWPLPNVWLGVSAEDQAAADKRIPILLATPAAVRFVSAEPLLGPIDFTHIGRDRGEHLSALEHVVGLGYERPRLDWIIVGGESGPGARPMHPIWARDIRDDCAIARTPFFFKQWGEWEPVSPVYDETCADEERIAQAVESRCEFVDETGARWPEHQPPAGSWTMERVGKARAGRELFGRTHDEMPA